MATGYRRSTTTEYVGFHPKIMCLSRTKRPRHLLEQGLRSYSVPSHAAVIALPKLHPGGGQGNQPLKKVGGHATPAAGVPETFPNLMRLPIIPMVEEVNPVQIGTAYLPLLRIESCPERRGSAKAMACRIAGGMRVLPTDVGIGWKRELRGKAGDGTGHQRYTTASKSWGANFINLIDKKVCCRGATGADTSFLWR